MLAKTIFYMILNLKYSDYIVVSYNVATWLYYYKMGIELASDLPIMFFVYFVLKARVMWSNSEVIILQEMILAEEEWNQKIALQADLALAIRKSQINFSNFRNTLIALIVLEVTGVSAELISLSFLT